MHEGGIAQSIVEILAEIKEQNELSCITAVTLKVGKMSGVMIYALEFALEAIKCEEKFIKNTKFNIISIDVKAKCSLCGREYQFADTDEVNLLCPDCQMPLTIISGKELEIVDVEGK